MFCRLLFVLLYFFLLAIALSVLLQCTDSDLPLWYLQTLLVNYLEIKRVEVYKEHIFTPCLSGFRVARSLVFCAMSCRSLFVPFVRFLLTIALYVLL